MSLSAFHKVFIAASIAMLAFVARWASGHNAAALVTPWARDAALLGIVALTPYFAWKVRTS